MTNFEVFPSGSDFVCTRAGVPIVQNTDANLVCQTAFDALQVADNLLLKDGAYPVSYLHLLNKQGVTLSAEANAIFNVIDPAVITPFTLVSYFMRLGNTSTSTITTFPAIHIDGCNSPLFRYLKVFDSGGQRVCNRDAFLIMDSQNFTFTECEATNPAGSAFRVRSNGTYDLSNPYSANTVLNSKHGLFQNCKIHGTQTFRNPENTTSVVKGFGYEMEFCEDMTVQNNEAHNTHESSCRTHYANNVKFLNNTILYDEATQQTWYGEPFDIYRASDVLIRGNTVSEVREPSVYIYEFTRNINVENNNLTSFSTTSKQIRLRAMPSYEIYPIEHITIKNNTMNGRIALQNSYLDDILVSGNTETEVFYQPYENGVPLTDPAQAVMYRNVSINPVITPVSLPFHDTLVDLSNWKFVKGTWTSK